MVEYVIKSAVQIIILTVFFYNFFTALYRNKADKFLRSLVYYLAIYALCMLFDLNVLEYIMKTMALPAIVFLCILYQPELRRSFVAGLTVKGKFFRLRDKKASSEEVENIVSACQRLSQAKRGALIVMPRKVSIKNIIDSGTRLDADISSALIVTIFDHDTPLHDGALVIQGNKIVAAACYLPLSSQLEIKQSFGTRHRAALGMVEESDAVVLVVSEETGTISLAYGGNLYYQLEVDVIKKTLISLLNGVEVQISEEN